MRLRTFLTAFSIALFLSNLGFASDKYKIDPGHAHVGFASKHFGLINMHCGFRDVSGTILFDGADVTKSSVQVTIKTASLFTENESREGAVKGPAFLNVQNYPEITFKSKRIKKDGDALTVTGDLTIMGVTKEVTFPFELVGPVADPWGNQRIGLAASLTVNRYDFGMGFDRKLEGGEPMIGSDVMISLSLEGHPREGIGDALMAPGCHEDTEGVVKPQIPISK